MLPTPLTTNRAPLLTQPIPKSIARLTFQYYETIENQYRSVSGDLQGLNAQRYTRNITGGNQEFVEAVSFQRYIETQTLISYEDACRCLEGLCAGVPLAPQDYVLGIFDMVGELMRFAITSMATNASSASAVHIDVLTDLRLLRSHLETFDPRQDFVFVSDVRQKTVVMRTCVEKAENAFYGLIIRGRGRPRPGFL